MEKNPDIVETASQATLKFCDSRVVVDELLPGSDSRVCFAKLGTMQCGPWTSQHPRRAAASDERPVHRLIPGHPG